MKLGNPRMGLKEQNGTNQNTTKQQRQQASRQSQQPTPKPYNRNTSAPHTMAATRKRKSTRTPAKSKKAKSEEVAESPVVEAETPEEKKEPSPPAAEEDADANENNKADPPKENGGKETTVIAPADTKDTHEAAEALLAVSGGDAAAETEKNGEGELHYLMLVRGGGSINITLMYLLFCMMLLSHGFDFLCTLLVPTVMMVSWEICRLLSLCFVASVPVVAAAAAC